jgi:hypothetical protein
MLGKNRIRKRNRTQTEKTTEHKPNNRTNKTDSGKHLPITKKFLFRSYSVKL